MTAASCVLARQAALAVSLAAQAAVALENSQLYAAIQQLFEGFVRASIVAIESRDPATSGHSFRVANLTVALAEAVDRADGGRSPACASRATRCARSATRRCCTTSARSAVREEVLVKAKKLYPGAARADARAFQAGAPQPRAGVGDARLDYLLAHGRDAYLERAAGLRARARRRDRAARPAVSRRRGRERADRRARRPLRRAAGTSRPSPISTWTAPTRPLLEEREVRLLSLRKGTLSELERLADRVARRALVSFPQPDSVDARDPPHPGDRARPPREAERHRLSRGGCRRPTFRSRRA